MAYGVADWKRPQARRLRYWVRRQAGCLPYN